MNQQFVENLICLRNHYQSLHEEIEREKVHARQQLTHVNALLIDRLREEHHFAQNLIELRNHYQGAVDEYDRRASHAKEQLIHVNALLADQLVLQHNQPVSIEASTVNEKKALTQSADIGIDQFRTASLELNQVDEPDEVSSALGSDEVEEVDERQEVDEPDEPNTAAAVVQSEPEPISSPSVSVNGQTPTSSLRPLKTLMLPKYQQMTKLQAVSSLLSENPGAILHIDYIIRALHGELEPDAIREEKGRMAQTLNEGAKKGLWHKAPQQAASYTLDLKLVEPELDSKETAQQSQVGFRRRAQFRGKSSNKMVPRYEQLNLIDAVEAVVSENAGQILSTDKVARTIYGDLEGQALTKAKDKVGKTLWSGAKQKRWQRVPGKLGLYTLDMKLVTKT